MSVVRFWLWKAPRWWRGRKHIDARHPKPTRQEWRDCYDWNRDIDRRIKDGTIEDIPPIEVQLADHFARLGLTRHYIGDAGAQRSTSGEVGQASGSSSETQP